MRYSKQREAILNAVQNQLNHPNAEQIYYTVQKEIPDISLGTVYRNLNALVDMNLIKRFMGTDEKDHFDKTVSNHFHVHCQNCNSIYDVEIDFDFETFLLKKYCFQLKKMDLVLNGICQNCREKKEGKEWN